MALEKLQSPPIVEVVCGVIFESLPNLDPLTLGAYWERKRDGYPRHQLHPPIMEEGATLQFETFPPIRSWFISEDEAWVIQMQWDRFYLNWRQQKGVYPRFSDRGSAEGVLSRFLREFDEFSEYAKAGFGIEPKPTGMELAKIDQFIAGVSWDGLDDLAMMLPWLQPFAAASDSKQPVIAAQFREERAGGHVTVRVDVNKIQSKLETRVVKKLDGDLRAAFESANAVLNEFFEKMIPAEQRARRFQGGGQ